MTSWSCDTLHIFLLQSSFRKSQLCVCVYACTLFFFFHTVSFLRIEIMYSASGESHWLEQGLSHSRYLLDTWTNQAVGSIGESQESHLLAAGVSWPGNFAFRLLWILEQISSRYKGWIMWLPSSVLLRWLFNLLSSLSPFNRSTSTVILVWFCPYGFHLCNNIIIVVESHGDLGMREWGKGSAF